MLKRLKETKKGELKRLNRLRNYRDYSALIIVSFIVAAAVTASPVWLLPVAGFLWAQIEKIF